jgi:hypothetical protein
MSEFLQPAASIIDRFGGAETVQSITGASRTRVYRWTQPKSAGGTGGVIPMQHAVKLLAHAREKNIAVTADDFLASENSGGHAA